MFFYGFFKNLPHKHYITEIFLITIVVLVFTKYLSGWKAKLLAFLCGIGVVFTHYAATALFLPAFAVLAVGIFVLTYLTDTDSDRYIINGSFVVFVGALFLSWYVFVSSGITFGMVIERVFLEVYQAPETVSDPPTRSGVGFLSALPDLVGWWGLTAITGLFIALIGTGLAGSLAHLGLQIARRDDLSTLDLTRSLYALFAIGPFLLIGMSAFFSFGLGIDRIVQLSFVVVSPYCLVGFRYVFAVLRRIRPSVSANVPSVSPASVMAVVLVGYLLFSSGAASVMIQEPVPDHGIAVSENEFNGEWNVFTEPHVAGAHWTVQHGTSPDIATTAEKNRYRPSYNLLLVGFYGFSYSVTPITSYGERFIEQSSPVQVIDDMETIPEGTQYGYIREPIRSGEYDDTERGLTVYRIYEDRDDRIYHNGNMLVYANTTE
jgi:uncharacterized membrane protein